MKKFHTEVTEPINQEVREALAAECTENLRDIFVASVPYLCDLCENPSLSFIARKNS
jgi:hypothetical protein